MKPFNKHVRNIITYICFVSYFVLSFLSLESNAFAANSEIFHPKQPFSPQMQAFIDTMVNRYQFNREELNNIMSQADIIPPVIHSIEKPMETAVTWDTYRKIFITPERVNGGVNYWHLHQKTLLTAQSVYGVDPSVIIAIIGVETLYGKEKERYQVLGALTTLAFYHKDRSAFFENELAQFLIMARQFHLPPLALRGSYAGAMGIPQFMPSSYLHFAVSYTHNPQIDLLNNHDDAIMSIAHYLKASGWKFEQPIAVPALIAQHTPPPWLVSNTVKIDYSLGTLSKYGIQSAIPLSPLQKTALIAMHDQHSDEYWLVFPNFSAIMSYNPRTSYALAVYELSQAIKNQYSKSL